MTEQTGKIYLVPTPIGNMSDITSRAIDTLQSVDIIACEDTRHSGNFLKNINVKKKLVSYHEFNETERASQLLQELESGKNIAVITDAGSPGISDPAFRIVRLAVENNIEIIPLPGPTALIPALTASGLPTDRFLFEGFLSNKKGARQKRLSQLIDFPHTILFYESPFRIEKMVADILEIFGNRQICIAREISKKFEQFIRGDVETVLAKIKSKPIKGEIVVVVEGNKEK